VATLAANTDTLIKFVNFTSAAAENLPTLIVNAGEWETGDAFESGVVFDVTGEETPILNTTDARKLAKWLTRAADTLDGKKSPPRKHKQRPHYDDDDDDNFSQYM
jgi:hypothetical protein